jgi:sulfate adenylyltransferase subunit 2
MDRLDELEAQSIYIFREAFARLHKVALLWSLGKDSNVMIWLARKAFFGRLPFPAMHVDTGKKFPEMYVFRDHYAKEWDLDLIVESCPPLETVDATLPPAARSAARKTEGLKLALAKHGFDGLFAGIRRDEEATRAKERVFSPRSTDGAWDVRDQPAEFWNHFNASPPQGAHLRVHPILQWTEADIWRYTRREGIPIIPLYLAVTAGAIAPWAIRTSRPRSRQTRAHSMKSSPRLRPPGLRSGRAAPWITNPKMRSNGFAPQAICSTSVIEYHK